MSIRKTFCKSLNYYMSKKGIKQSDLVTHFKIAKSTISSWCTGTKLPRMDKIEALAAFLGIKTSDLLNEKTIDVNEVFVMEITEHLSPELQKLLNNYNKLNISGKEKANEYISNLITIEKYIDADSNFKTTLG